MENYPKMASETAAPKRTFTFVWQIQNFSRFLKGKCFLISPTFKAFSLNNTCWHVKIQSRIDPGDKEYICVSLLNETSGLACSPLFDWEYSFLDNKEAPIFTATVRNYNFRNSLICNVPTGPTWEDIIIKNTFNNHQEDSLTLRLRLWQSAEKRPDDDEHCSASTLIGLDRISIIWNIERFSLIPMGQELKNSFQFPNSGSSCNISFSLVGKSLTHSIANIAFSEELNKLSSMSCKISLLDTDNKVIKTVEDQCTFNQFLDKDVWVLRGFLTRQEIFLKETQCLKEDVLSLFLEFEVNVNQNVEPTYYHPADPKSFQKLSGSKENNRTSQNDSSPPELKYNKVANCLNDVYPKCDFELRSGTNFFLVHKLVLSAQSRVFEKMSYGDKKTIHANHLSIKDMDYETLKSMLYFMYGKPMQLHGWESAVSLYNAAAEYQVQSLMEQCSLILQSLISVFNVCNILLLADRNSDEKLKSFVHDFLVVNLNEVVSSQIWNEFRVENLTLADITLEILYRRLERKTKKRLNSSPCEKKDNRIGSAESEARAKKDKQIKFLRL